MLGLGRCLSPLKPDSVEERGLAYLNDASQQYASVAKAEVDRSAPVAVTYRVNTCLDIEPGRPRQSGGFEHKS
ncbi:hypothetical protein BAUCODRAFT_485073 [Baudoinia panamericana UAMH 10762]|uniref:Uncharacterized protein n=1 Tax=Baudoinia panamericana (strain UAMH 10762) TaxID=717646 RepID=M2LQF4_BAUPA|nr:uncharacterized protein BAUCODRAFT_485073 [Baudoinia panamericana UAMH 10762]EMC96662.1 hypothetical protein BAUCODRAFT_485073 [Baudoinia panamericana UAMH 10762]